MRAGAPIARSAAVAVACSKALGGSMDWRPGRRAQTHWCSAPRRSVRRPLTGPSTWPSRPDKRTPRRRRTSARSPAFAAAARWRPRPQARVTAGSIGGPTAGNIEHRAGGKRAFARGAERDQGSNFLNRDESPARNLCEHEVDVCLRDLLEDGGLGGRGRDAVDGNVVAGQFLAQG